MLLFGRREQRTQTGYLRFVAILFCEQRGMEFVRFDEFAAERVESLWRERVVFWWDLQILEIHS